MTTTWTNAETTQYNMKVMFNAPGHLHSEQREGKMHLVNVSRWTKEGDEPVDEFSGSSLCHRLRERTFKVCLLPHGREYTWCKDCLRISER